ncbi:hypothetical protein [Shinella sumterensis]|uniref:hypothetical protein n=1 Tax=Shinella sumterensis TaxID=1967501 RepID=UPI003F857273
MCDSLEKDAPKGAGLQAGLHASPNMLFPRKRKIILSDAANRCNFGKISCSRVDSADPANVLSGYENIHHRQANRRVGRLTGARRQHRPFYPAFCLLCSALTCILLLAFTLSAPVAGSVAPRVLVHGAQKNAGSLSASAGLEGAKGQVAGKLMSSDGRGVELICPLEAVFTGPFGSAAGVGPGRSRCFADSHLVTSAARAPPADIA